MNAFLLSIGIAVALVLSAAFAAPLIVDWNDYRAVMERHASEIVGRPVAIEGPIDVRIVPFPTLRARDVRIGGADGGEGVDALYARGGLMPLLSGELHVSELVLDRPRLRLSISPDGFVAWGAETEPAFIPLTPDRVRVDRFEVRGGSVVVEDARNGNTYAVEALTVDGSAASLAGPYKFEGDGVLQGERYDMQVALGRVQPNGGLRVGATFRPDGGDIALTVDGNLAYGEGHPEYRGRVSLQNHMAEPPAEGEGEAAEAPAAEPNAEGETAGPDAEAPFWRFEASTVASAESLVLDQLGLRIGGDEHPIALSGAAQVEFGRAPRFQAVLSTRQIDVDRAMGGGPDKPVPPHLAIAALGDMVKPGLVPFEGRLSLDIGSLVLGGNIVEALGAEIVFEQGGWRISRGEARLPGDTEVALSGRVVPDADDARFVGAVTVAAEHASPLAAWLFRQEARLPGIGAVTGRLSASASIEMKRNSLTLDRLEVKTDRNQLSGSLAYAAPDTGRRRLDVTLKTDHLDMRGLPLDRFADNLKGNFSGSDGGAIDLALDLDAGELVAGTVAATDVQVRGLLTGEGLEIERLHVGDVAGLAISAEGELADLGGEPAGDLEVRLSGDNLAAAARTADLLDYDALAALLDERARVLVPLDLGLRLTSRVEDGVSGLDVRLDGQAGGTDLFGTARLEGRLQALAEAGLEIRLSARNPDAAALFSQVSRLEAASTGPGSLGLTASGSGREGLAFELSGEGLPLAGKVSGEVAWPDGGERTLEADLALDVRDPRVFLSLVGLSKLAEIAEGGPLSASVAGQGTRYTLSDLRYDGAAALRGSLVVDTGAAAQVGGTLQADSIALDTLIPRALGVASILETDGGTAGETARWSEEPFASPDTGAWSVALDLSAPEARWDELELSDVAFRIVSDEDGFAFRNISGLLWDGRLGGDIELQSLRGALNMAARLQITDASLGEFAWRDDGRPVARGRADLALDLNGGGRTPLALVTSLAGDGSFALRNGTIRRMSPQAFASVVAAADEGLIVEAGPVAEMLGEELDKGALSYDAMQGGIAAAGGVLHVGRVQLDSPELTVFASGELDIAGLSVESDWTLRAAQTGDDRAQEVSLHFEGPIGSPARSIEASAMVNFLTVRQFELELQRLEELQAEIEERERVRRELDQLNRGSGDGADRTGADPATADQAEGDEAASPETGAVAPAEQAAPAADAAPGAAETSQPQAPEPAPAQPAAPAPEPAPAQQAAPEGDAVSPEGSVAEDRPAETAPGGETEPPRDEAAAPPAADAPISLDRDEFRRTIQDLLRDVDGLGGSSLAPARAPAPAAAPARSLPDTQMRGPIPGRSLAGQPLNIQPGAQ